LPFVCLLAGFAWAADDDLPCVDVWLVPSLRGDLAVTLDAYNLRDVPLATIRFAGFIPGDFLIPVDGMHAWDVGFLAISPECLRYQGERADFSVARNAVM
jgi:hypothetical protein